MAPISSKDKSSGSKRKADSTKEPYVKGAKKSKVTEEAKPEKKSKKEEKPEKKAKKPKKVELDDEDDSMSVDSDSEGGVALSPVEANEDTEMGGAEQDGIHPERRAFAAGQGPNGMWYPTMAASGF